MLEAGRTFKIGSREFEFDENEPIFFMRQPIINRLFHNTTTGCNTCGTRWTSTKDLLDSNCQFCGISNCKNCLKKTRKFFVDEKKSKITGSSILDKAEVGKICKLCDRKFFIREMLEQKIKVQKAQALTIENSRKQIKDWQGEMVQLAEKNRIKVLESKTILETTTNQATQVEEVITKLKREKEDLQDDTNTSQKKELRLRDRQ